MSSSWSSPPSQEARGVANMYFFRFHALQLLSYKSAALDAAWKCPLSSSRFMTMMKISMISKRGETDNSTGIGSRVRQDQGIKLLVYASDPLPVPPTHLPWVRACKLSPLSPLCPQHTHGHTCPPPHIAPHLRAFKRKQVQHGVGFFPWFLSSLDPRLSSCWFINFLIVRVRYRLWKMTPKQSRCCLSRASVAQSGLLPECPWVWASWIWKNSRLDSIICRLVEFVRIRSKSKQQSDDETSRLVYSRHPVRSGNNS